MAHGKPLTLAAVKPSDVLVNEVDLQIVLTWLGRCRDNDRYNRCDPRPDCLRHWRTLAFRDDRRPDRVDQRKDARIAGA